MIPLSLWLAIAAVALLLTLMWAVLARRTGIYMTSGLSFTAWAWLSLVGSDVARIGKSGSLTWLTHPMASLQVLALSLALISLVVFTLRLLGSYPSPADNAAIYNEG